MSIIGSDYPVKYRVPLQKCLNNLKPRLKRSGLSNLHPQLIANENDLKIKRLAGNFRLSDAGEALAGQGIAVNTGKYLQLLPHLHGTDGFFAAIMEKG